MNCTMKEGASRRHQPIFLARSVVRLYFSHNVSRAAAELSYFLLLTFFPILICISALISQLHLDPAQTAAEFQYLLPQSISVILQEYLLYVSNNQSAMLFYAGLTMAILFAASAMRGLMNITQEIYGQKTFHGAIQWLISVLFALLLLIIIYLAIIIMVTGDRFIRSVGLLFCAEEWIEQLIPWQWLKYVAFAVVVVCLVMILYRFSAPLKKPRPPVFPGAVSTAVMMAVASSVFSVFMEHSTRYSLVYGSLASVIILLIWLYLCGNILILGVLVNYVSFEERKKHT